MSVAKNSSGELPLVSQTQIRSNEVVSFSSSLHKLSSLISSTEDKFNATVLP